MEWTVFSGQGNDSVLQLYAQSTLIDEVQSWACTHTYFLTWPFFNRNVGEQLVFPSTLFTSNVHAFKSYVLNELGEKRSLR